jgi:pimeloyl-ACP methyl ester carboxylesterase
VAAILLVHGAWLDGSSWVKILPDLKSIGYPIIAVQLPLTSLREDVATVRRAMVRESGPLLLVGHGYGGSVITAAGNTGQVKGLVFIAAFAPDASESAASLLTLVPKAPLAGEMRSDSDGYIRLTAKGIHEDFAQDLTATEKTALVASQAPTSINALSGAIEDCAWRRSIPSWYLVTENDRTIPPRLQFMMAAKVHAQTASTPTSHVAMLSRPDVVASIVGNAAGLAFQRA